MAQADLRPLGMPAARAEALSSLAGAAAVDPSLFSATQTLESAIAKLRSLRGIGEWTAQYIAMRVLREPDAFPAADIGLMRALTPAGGRRPSASDVLARAEVWRPWRAYAAQHLWTVDAEALHANPHGNPKDEFDAQSDASKNVLYRPGRKPDRDNAPHP
jgi:AraC family transcriptional regulator of adaptative response / DNA-3-methyladenine glycosylase II